MIVLDEDLRKRLRAVQIGGFWGGLGLLGASFLGGYFDPATFFPAYLSGYLFWIGLALGSMAILMVHYQVGGSWGYLTRRILEAAMGTLPLLGFLFLPLLLGRRTLMPWVMEGDRTSSSGLGHLERYLSPGYVLFRAGLYFALWLSLAFLLGRWSQRQDRNPDPRLLLFLRRLSGPGLPLYAVSVLFATADWVLSTEPAFSSSILGLLTVSSQVVSGFALAIAVLLLLADRPPMSDVLSPDRRGDLGNLLLTAVMLWSYLSFSQYLIVWSGNLPREVSWYVHRSSPPWRFLALVLIVLHIALPIALLLFRAVKRSGLLLGGLAWLLLGLRLLDGWWQILPAFWPEGPILHWIPLATAGGMGGLWIALFLDRLGRMSLLPLHDDAFSHILREARTHV